MVYLIIISYCILLAAIFGSALIKAKNHFEYLKIIESKEYGRYPSYFSVFTLNFYSVKLQFLALPFFNRKKELENELAAKQAIKVKKMLMIHLFTIFLMGVFIGLLILMSDEI